LYRILLATDGSENSQRVVEEVLRIAEALKAEVTALHVIEQYDRSYMAYTPYKVEIRDDLNHIKQLEADRIIEEAAKPFRDKGLAIKTEIIVSKDKSPADIICDIASRGEYNLIAIGSRGLRGVKELFLGSVSNKVAHIGCTNVLIVR